MFDTFQYRITTNPTYLTYSTATSPLKALFFMGTVEYVGFVELPTI